MTGKVKEMFEKWLIKYIYPEHYYSVTYTVKQNGEKVYGTTALMGKDLKQIVEMFNILPFAMKQGVYLQFFREQGVEIEITKWVNTHRESEYTRTNQYYWIIYVDNEFKSLEQECKVYKMQTDYNTAFTQAIEKACNILEGK